MMQWLGSLKVHNFTQTQARLQEALASGATVTEQPDGDSAVS